MKNYSICEAKRFIQKEVMSLLKGFASNSLVLGGPNFKEYVSFIKDNISFCINSTINSYEIDNETLQLQINEYCKFSNSLKRKVRINGGDILQATPERFIDLDLKRTLVTESSLISRMFNKQKNLKAKDKAFCFTFCQRSAIKNDNCLDNLEHFLRHMLKCSVIITNGYESLSFGKKYHVICQKYDIHIFSYKSECSPPMITCLIKY